MNTLIHRAVMAAAETAKAGGTQTTVPTLSDKDKEFAWKRISAAYDAYWGKGGIKDLTDQLETKTETTYRHQLYLIAQYACDASKGGVKTAMPNLKVARAIFVAQLDYAEEQLKSEHKDKETGRLPAIAQLLPGWPTTKSKMLVSFDYSVDPTAKDNVSHKEIYPNATRWMEAGQKAQATVIGSDGSGTGENAGGSVFTLELVSERLDPVLKGAMHALAQNIDVMPQELHLWAANGVIGLVNSFSTATAEFQKRFNAAGNVLSKAAEIAEQVTGFTPPTRPVAQATSGDPKQDAESAKRIEAENAERGQPRKAKAL